MAQITIHRKNEFAYRGRTFKVMLDGKTVANLEAGNSITIDVVPGLHIIQAKMGWLTKSNSLKFNIFEDSLSRFSLGALSKGFLSSFIEIKSM